MSDRVFFRNDLRLAFRGGIDDPLFESDSGSISREAICS